MTWETVIGLEVHVQLATESKLFSGGSTRYGQTPNSQACAIDLGMPGVLPVLNREAVDMAIRFGTAVDATITQKTSFARKNYFYPDLPKGYQISQHHGPIVVGGEITIELADGTSKAIVLERAHLEEDAGKALHDEFHGQTGVDLNRAGIPLIEIVSTPCMSSSEEAVAYLKTLHSLVRCLGISDANMQEGSFRCDCNVSVRRKGEPLGTRTETKNVNSFRYVEKAIHYEVQRQIALLEAGGEVDQETLLFDPDTGETRMMRSKEDANDYRYFPCPDLLPVNIDSAHIGSIRKGLPELPWQTRDRLQKTHQLSRYDATILTSQSAISHYFEAVIAHNITPKLAANWISGELMGMINKCGLEFQEVPIDAERFSKLLQRIEDGTISGKIAKTIFESMWESQDAADAIIEAKGLKQISDSSAIDRIIQEVLEANPGQLEQYRLGKDKLFGFFVGQVMKVSQGKANPQQVNTLLKKALDGKA